MTTKYSNSSLVNCVVLSPNYSAGRISASLNPEGVIDTITIHHMAGKCNVETCGRIFQGDRQASSNYGVDSDGRIGMYVEEKNRSWCTSSRANDIRAITIEVSNDGGASTNWHVSDKALAATIRLVIDICERNNIKKINFTGDKSGNLTMHNWFAATGCPGAYLESKFPYIAEQVNIALGADIEEDDGVVTGTITKGDVVKVKEGAYYYQSRVKVPEMVLSNQFVVSSVSGNRVVIDKSLDELYSICSPVHMNDLILVEDRDAEPSDNGSDSETNTGNGKLVAGMMFTLDGVNLYSASTSARRSNTVTGTYYAWSAEVSNNRIKITNSTENVGKDDQVTGWINYSDIESQLTAVPDTLPVTPTPTPEPSPEPDVDTTVMFHKGDVVKIKSGSKYYGLDKVVPYWVIEKQWIVSEDQVDDRVVINQSTDGKNAINSAVHADDLTKVGESSTSFNQGDTVRIVQSCKKWATGQSIPAWVYLRTLYVRSDVRKDGTVQVSTLKTGTAITGVIHISNIQKI